MTQKLSERPSAAQFSPGEDDSWGLHSDQHGVWRIQSHSRLWRPPTDVLETEDTYIVEVEIAGMRGAEFAVSFSEQVLSIRGTRAKSGKQQAYHQMEITYGQFETHITIPSGIDTENIDATYVDGFLRVVLPKASPRNVPIDDAG
jgi:HSP20 family protein